MPWSEPLVGAWETRRVGEQSDEFQKLKARKAPHMSLLQEMTSQQGEVLRIVRELEFDHHSNLA